jgi:hypothetical protein
MFAPLGRDEFGKGLGHTINYTYSLPKCFIWDAGMLHNGKAFVKTMCTIRIEISTLAVDLSIQTKYQK